MRRACLFLLLSSIALGAQALGACHSIALRRDGTLWIWGNNFIEQGPGILGKNLHVPTRLDLP